MSEAVGRRRWARVPTHRRVLRDRVLRQRTAPVRTASPIWWAMPARRATRAGRFRFKLTTNRLLLDEAFLKFAVRNDVLIAMSFDGIREAHDLHRRLPNGGPTFDVLLERLQFC